MQLLFPSGVLLFWHLSSYDDDFACCCLNSTVKEHGILFHGHDGQDQLQAATPVHLRSGLGGAAWEVARKIDHSKLKTKDSERKMNFLLSTVKEMTQLKNQFVQMSCAWSASTPPVWRKISETMQQDVVRRENSLSRLKESSPETGVSQNLRTMMLLLFSSLDQLQNHPNLRRASAIR